jgi:hypothetical protein
VREQVEIATLLETPIQIKKCKDCGWPHTIGITRKTRQHFLGRDVDVTWYTCPMTGARIDILTVEVEGG